MFWVNNHLLLDICVVNKKTKNHEDKKKLILVNNMNQISTKTKSNW